MRTRDAKRLAEQLADSLFVSYDDVKIDRLLAERSGRVVGGWSYGFAVKRLTAVLVKSDRKTKR